MDLSSQLTLALWGYGLLTLVCEGLVTWKYRSLWHPLLLPGAQLGVMACLAPLAQDVPHSLLFPTVWWLETSLLSSLYLVCCTLPLLWNWNPLLGPVEACLGQWQVRRDPRLPGAYLTASLLLLGVGGVLFALLLRDSSAGWSWLLDPRGAYREGRAGVGHWYILSQTAWFLSCLLWLYYLRPRSLWKLAIATLVFAAGFALFGSKAGLLSVVIAVGVYYNFYVREFRLHECLLGIACLLPVVLISPWLQGNFDSLRETLMYYDYFDNAARYVGRADRFGPQYGGAFLSTLWEYVPRGLYPDKPYVYGNIVVNEYWFPGAAKEGYTPGWLPWILLHLDFGAAGVAGGGLLVGFLGKAIHTHFLRTRSFPAYLAFLQMSFLPVLKLAPVLYFLVLLWGLAWGGRAWLAMWNLWWPVSQEVGKNTARQEPLPSQNRGMANP